MIVKESIKALNKATVILRKGGVVICPTDTVYGFLADASNKKAVDKIYKIKKRLKSKPLPVFVKDIKTAHELAQIDERQAKILRKFWPGKYTFVLTRKKYYKTNGRKSRSTIALRIPKHVFLQKLLKKINKPLVQTSVNISGEPSLNNINDIIEKFGQNKSVDLIINAGNLKKSLPALAMPKALQAGKPSTIIDLTSNQLIRLR